MLKLDKIKQVDNKELIKYGIVVAITLLLCSGFLQMHYSSDTYVLYDLGYMQYPSEYFLLDGRLISTLVCYLGGILNLPIPVYIVAMDFLGIVFLASSIYLIYKILEKLIKPKKDIVKWMLLACCFILILNQFTLEYLLFPESAVMCLGVLFNVIAIKIMVNNPKHKYLKIFFALLIAGFCYQGVLNIFPVLAVLVYIVKMINDKRNYKENLKEFIIEMIKLAAIIGIILIICMITIKIGTNLLNSNQDRTIQLENEKQFQQRKDTIVEFMDELWNKSMNLLPEHTNTIVIIISFVLLFVLKTRKTVILRYILLVVLSFGMCIGPMFVFNTGVTGRVNQPLAMLWGASLIILLVQTLTISSYKKQRLIYGLIILSFIINSMFIVQNISEHIASNKVEENYGKTIKEALDRYESESGKKITKFSYVYDRNPEQHAVAIKKQSSLTERKLACTWSIVQAMNYYCERKLERVKMPTRIYVDNFANKDYKAFSENQLYFENDTVYMLVY